MKKKGIILLLSLLLSMAYINVFAGNIVFADANVKAICVANWDTNYDGELSEAEAAAVMSLGEVFKGNTEITSFDELQYFTGLTSINDNAFMGSSISSVVFPKNITSIGNCAFAGCDDLGPIILPEGVVNIGSSAFAGLSGEQSQHPYAHGYVYFPSTIKTVGENAFWRGVGVVDIADLAAWCGIDFQGADANPMSYNGCIIVNGKEVTDLVIPEGVTSIGTCAFIQIPGFYPDGNYIQSVKLPSTLVTIGNGAFGRSRISEIDIPSSVKSIGSNAFAESSLGSVTLHEGLETIEESAFYDCDGLTSIDIPAGVNIIGGAFGDCDNLTSVRVREGEPSEMDVVSTFSNCANATLYTPGLSLRKEGGSHNFIDSHQAYMDNWPGFKEYVAIEEDGDYFNPDNLGCLMRVICAEQSTAEIAVFWPFESGVSGSGTFNIPSTVASEQSGKVYTITSINRDSGFDYAMMSGSCDLKLPSSITYIKSGALPGNAFRSIIVDAANPVYDSRDNCNAVIETATNKLVAGCFNTTIPESVTAIGEAAFADITSLKEITIPASVASIDRYAFWGCENLTSVTVEWAEPITSTSEISDWFPSCFNATLYVPYGTKAAYEASEWVNFKEIVEYGAPEVEKYTLEILGHFNPDESYLYNRDGKEYDVSDFAYNEFDEGSYIRIEPFVYPGSYYIREILVNGESVGVWTDENTAPTEYVIESLSCNTTVEFRTYYNERLRTLSCKAEGPGNIKMYKNDILVGTTPDQGNPRYCSAVFNEGDVLKLEFIPDAGCALTQFLGSFMGDGDVDMFNLSGDVTDNIYTISFPYYYNDDYPLLRCFAATFEKETRDYSLTVDPGNYCTVEHLYVKKGDEVIEAIDGENSCSVEEGCSVGIELSVPAGLYIREIIVNDVTVATYTDEDVANGNNTDGYLLENISENTVVKFKTYPRVRSFGCTASGPGKVEMYRNGNYVGTTTSQDGGYPYLTCEALDEGEVLKLVFVSDKGGSFTKLMAGEHDGYEDTDFTGKVVDNTFTITMDFDNEEVLQYRSFIAYFEGPEPSTNNTLSASVPTLLTGQTATMSVSLTNEDEIIMTEFYMQLPEGITIEEDEDGYPKVTLNSERSNNHSLEVSRNSEGLYHFLVFSSRNYALKGHEGELFSMNLLCAEGVAAGTYQATVKNILLSDPNKNEITPSNFTFDVTVMDVAMGDANGDGRINGMDIVEMVDYIMERPSDTFVFAAADLTADQKVNGMDLVELVSLVMAQGAASPQLLSKGKGAQMPHHFDSGLTLTSHNDGSLTLGVEKSDAFILAQMIVEVDGEQLTDVTTDTKHEAVWRQIGENRYAVLAYSTKNRPFAANDELLKLFFANDANSIRVTDVMLASAEREERRFESVAYGSATGINSIGDSEWANGGSVYDLQGRKVMSTLPRKGIYIMNGKKVVRK